MKINKHEFKSFDDFRIIPKYSEISSRSQVDTSSRLYSEDGSEYNFKIPIISSCMDTVTEHQMLGRMCINGGLGILHRFKSIDWMCNELKLAQEIVEKESTCESIFGVAVGVSGDFLERTQEAIKNKNVKIICIDIAHGHHVNAKNAILQLKKILKPHHHVMAGNVATYDGFRFLIDNGADSIRVGIGSGASCSTQIQTGHGMPLASSLIEISENWIDKNPQKSIIADGGIKNSGDICKSLGFGANFVMLGSLLAGTKASPGSIIQDDSGRWFKAYRGAASEAAQIAAGKKEVRAEGVSAQVKYTGKLEKVLSSLQKGIQSGFSYSGCLNLFDFQENCEFCIVSNSGHIEGTPHIYLRK